MAPFLFQGLAFFWKLVNSTIVNSLTRFYDTSYVSSAVIPVDIFQSQTKTFGS
jgi:hypothetical protein